MKKKIVSSIILLFIGGGQVISLSIPSRSSGNFIASMADVLFTIGSDDEIDVESSEDDEERENERSTKKKNDLKRKSNSFSFDFDDGENIIGHHRHSRLTEIVDDNQEDDDNDDEDDEEDEVGDDDEIEDDTIRTMVRGNLSYLPSHLRLF